MNSSDSQQPAAFNSMNAIVINAPPTFVILHNLGPIGFEGLRRRLGTISPRVLSWKLKMMEGQGIVRRTLIDTRPPSVRYSLTEKGATVAKIGTPVFLFFTFREQSGPR